MKHRYYVVISVILIGIVIVGLVYLDYISNRTKVRTPLVGLTPALYTLSISPEGINASQGTVQRVNLTLTSIYSGEIEVPIENLTIESYTNSINYGYSILGTIGWNISAQEKVFNYSFSFSRLILGPRLSNSTILTINLAKNATLGSYALDIILGKYVFLSLPEPQPAYLEDIPLVMVVTPNETS